ncbi:hypothetical protein QIS99_08705 [Streptomyces sp. B-S-A8]|uniref:DUF1449 family protein n=1 Tax=Streptomyces solicavernae TaxID=3043614 RepID=A0ABT6RPQ8_9ACTN|nr:hypothetical protein [Streptomyces sp. B-S-A8]MDI3386295.1 hypothetical protein [Streptomyces sp. B-S-A8]
MGELLGAAVGFPGVVFSSALLVVVAFWLLVLLGGLDADGFDGDVDLGALGLGGVPVTVAASLVIVVGWLTGVTGSVLAGRAALGGFAHIAADAVVLLLSLAVAWCAARALVRPMAKLFPDEPGPSRQDFVGALCTIRTGRVDAEFGQAEVAARDGSTAIVQVRQYGSDALSGGSTGLLYAYDDTGEFFWVAAHDAELGSAPLDRAPRIRRP